MKKLIFAVALGVATLFSFSSCSKDDVEPKSPTPELQVLRQYSSLSTNGLVRFYYEIKIISETGFVLPVQSNLDQISVKIDPVVTDSIFKQIYLLEIASGVKMLMPEKQGYYQVLPGKEYRMQILVDAPVVPASLYEVSVGSFVFKRDLFKISESVKYPEYMKLDFFHP